MSTVVFRAKKNALEGLEFEEFILMDPFDRSSYTMPFNEIVTLVIGIVGSGGIIGSVTAILTKKIEIKKSNIKIRTTKNGDVEIDCTNTKPDEVKELYKTIIALANEANNDNTPSLIT